MTRTKLQFFGGLKNVVILSDLLAQLLLKFHHVGVGDCDSRGDLASWGHFLIGFVGVQNLVIELDFVLEALTTAVEKSHSFFFITIDGYFGLGGLEGPTFLILKHLISLRHAWLSLHGTVHRAAEGTVLANEHVRLVWARVQIACLFHAR